MAALYAKKAILMGEDHLTHAIQIAFHVQLKLENTSVVMLTFRSTSMERLVIPARPIPIHLPLKMQALQLRLLPLLL